MELMKCVLLVRSDLSLSKGKTVAQCGHALVESIISSNSEKITVWRQQGEPIITLKVPNEKTMNYICARAHRKKVFNYIVCDAGETEVLPDTNTVCVIGPDKTEKINSLVKDLKLY